MNSVCLEISIIDFIDWSWCRLELSDVLLNFRRLIPFRSVEE